MWTSDERATHGVKLIDIIGLKQFMISVKHEVIDINQTSCVENTRTILGKNTITGKKQTKIIKHIHLLMWTCVLYMLKYFFRNGVALPCLLLSVLSYGRRIGNKRSPMTNISSHRPQSNVHLWRSFLRCMIRNVAVIIKQLILSITVKR